MEDELDQEGMEEEADEPKPSKGGGSPIKMIAIVGVMLLAAIYLVFFGPLKGLLGDEPVEGEVEEMPAENFDTEYAAEYVVPEYVHSMLDERGKVKNLVFKITFVAPPGALPELTRRSGQVTDIIGRNVNKFTFKELLEQAYKDSLSMNIRDEVNTYLPDRNNLVQRVYLQVVTM